MNQFNKGTVPAIASAAFALALMATTSFAQADEAFVAAAKEATQSRTAIQTEWLGPTTGPKAEPGKRIVYLSSDQNNALSAQYGEFLKDAASKIGWEVTVIDGKATAANWINAFNQALALNPDGIAMTLQSPSVTGPLESAAQLGIPVVGMHSTSLPGPSEEYHLYNNLSSDPAEIGRAMVDWAVADSNGTANLIFIGDNIYPISVVKTDAMVEHVAGCDTCNLISNENIPAANVSAQMGGIMTNWVLQYPKPLYVLAVGDFWFDFATPALRTGNVPTQDVVLIGADGTPQAYQRVRDNDYQVVTVPEPIEMQSWQAIDELNRAIHGEAPSTFVQPVYIVTKDNISAQGGDQNTFTPDNNFKDHYLSIWLGQ
ncbi:MAG: substrate-binding domain-containing protein [Hyphomicrobiaceae bacterium]|nr:substrate-binding domain-containing protein [Hyphomicrobiaceae bacterium]